MGPNHWAVRRSGDSRHHCLGSRLYLGAASIEEMKKPPGQAAGRRAHLLTRDEARRIAANIAKLLELLHTKR